MEDQQIASEFGFFPEEISGIPAEEVRMRMRDTNFQDAITAGMKKIKDGDLGIDAALDIANDWIETTGDRIGARILQEIIASFDLENQ